MNAANEPNAMCANTPWVGVYAKVTGMHLAMHWAVGRIEEPKLEWKTGTMHTHTHL